MTAGLLLSRESALFETLHAAARERRCVFLAGLPGVGKSLLLQQLVLIADELGRVVHLLQWDVSRGGFETPEILARFPEENGVTHPAIRRAVGLWAREAVARWDRDHPEVRHLLIGETPLVGNRLVELARREDDRVEALLAGEGTSFLVPVPTREVRAAIEASRVREMASPRHERERANAPPDLVRAHWEEIDQLARRLGVPASGSGGQYDPDVYAAVYLRLLRRRRAEALPIAELLPVRASAYDIAVAVRELVPTPEEAERAMARVREQPEAQLLRDVERWFEV